jgi:hypothetical protein
MWITHHNCTNVRVKSHDPANSNEITLLIESSGTKMNLTLFGLPEHITDALVELNGLIEAAKAKANAEAAVEPSITEAA